MKIKTITGPTIQAALSEARNQLGDNVILLESIPAEGGRPAMIKVALDPNPSAPVSATLKPQPVLEPVGFGYGAVRRSFTPANAQHASAPPPAPVQIPRAPVSTPTAPPVRVGSGGGPLIPPRNEPVRSSGNVRVERQKAAPINSDLNRQLDAMQRRLNQLERSVAAPKPAQRTWRSIPMLRQMARRGLREATLTRLADRVQSFRSETGVRDAEAVIIRNELRRMLQAPVLRPAPPALLVMGSGGPGKTSLIIKLARHDEYFGRRKTAVILVEPDSGSAASYAAIDRYRQHGLPVQCVGSREEMRIALERVERFDHVLIDTPPLPTQADAALAFATQVQDIVQDIVPMHVQLVLDASRVLSPATLTCWKNLPLRPSSTAITRLDEADVWGRFAEWLMHLGLPYGYASDGTDIPGGLTTLSASRITEAITSDAE